MDETIVVLRDIVNDYPHGINAQYLQELYESRSGTSYAPLS